MGELSAVQFTINSFIITFGFFSVHFADFMAKITQRKLLPYVL